jgi:hypothetical protein
MLQPASSKRFPAGAPVPRPRRDVTAHHAQATPAGVDASFSPRRPRCCANPLPRRHKTRRSLARLRRLHRISRPPQVFNSIRPPVSSPTRPSSPSAAKAAPRSPMRRPPRPTGAGGPPPPPSTCAAPSTAQKKAASGTVQPHLSAAVLSL